MYRSRLFAVIAFMSWAGGVFSQDLSRLRLADGSGQERAQLKSASRDWSFDFLINGAIKNVSAEQFISWGNRAPLPQRPSILLRDGTRIVLDSVEQIVRFENGHLQLEPSEWEPMSIPRERLATIDYASDLSDLKATRFQLDRFFDRKEDVVVLSSGQSQRGRFVGIDTNLVRMNSGTEAIVIRRREIRSIRFANRIEQPRLLDEPYALIGLRNGGVLHSGSIWLDDKQRLSIDLGGGVIVKSKNGPLPGTDLIRSVRLIHPSVKFLSDIQPFAYKHIPFLTLQWSYGLDRNLFDAPLRYRAIPFSKGIAMHSLSRLAFRLPSGFDRFEAEIALDDSSGPGGSVIFRVFLENGGNWAEEFHSESIVFGMPATDCRVDLNRATGIALVVDGATDTDFLDHANWLDARLVKID